MPGIWELLGRKVPSGRPGVEVFRNLEVLKLKSLEVVGTGLLKGLGDSKSGSWS